VLSAARIVTTGGVVRCRVVTRWAVLVLVLQSGLAVADPPICTGVTLGVGAMNLSGPHTAVAVEAYGGFMPMHSLCLLVDGMVADALQDTDEGTLTNRQSMVGGGVRYWFIKRAWVQPVLGVGRASHGLAGMIRGDTGLSYSFAAGVDFYRNGHAACEVGARYSDGRYDDPDPFWLVTLHLGCSWH
jgi:hypothetical protein